ncbi:MAG: hypothetical protein FWF46_04725 [Oscillospiraceae bacterium]|nr:hypothetical protein [Oscillospiraceae bacterium]
MSKISEKSSNKIYCCFDDSGNTLQETLKVSFLDYLTLKENTKPLANTEKES